MTRVRRKSELVFQVKEKRGLTMAIQSESFFEAPATNGTSRYSNPEVHLFGSPELASEFEEETGMYSNPEVGAIGMGEMEGEEEIEWGTREVRPETESEF